MDRQLNGKVGCEWSRCFSRPGFFGFFLRTPRTNEQVLAAGFGQKKFAATDKGDDESPSLMIYQNQSAWRSTVIDKTRPRSGIAPCLVTSSF